MQAYFTSGIDDFAAPTHGLLTFLFACDISHEEFLFDLSSEFALALSLLSSRLAFILQL